jgi:periplasmic divalent cation tolerance protein
MSDVRRFGLAIEAGKPSNMPMKSAISYAVVLVTVPDLATARKMVQAALLAKAAACANLVPKIESHYWWKGKLEQTAEVLLLFKTDRLKMARLEKIVMSHHPYDTPEIIMMPLTSGSERFLKWMRDTLTP